MCSAAQRPEVRIAADFLLQLLDGMAGNLDDLPALGAREMLVVLAAVKVLIPVRILTPGSLSEIPALLPAIETHLRTLFECTKQARSVCRFRARVPFLSPGQDQKERAGSKEQDRCGTVIDT
jgi:hypothetical protein